MNIKLLSSIALILLTTTMVQSQSYWFGLKGGMTLGVQQWNNFDQDPLIKYHGIAFIESAEETGQFGIFAQAGLHLKGSAIRNRNFFSPINGQIYRPPAQQFIFRNASVVLGGKQKKWLTEGSRWYYLIGLRADYTVSTNLDEYRELNELNNSLFFPDDFFVRKFNYGATVGGGIEFDFSEFVGALIELTVNPDFSFQYKQPAISNVYNPYLGTNTTIGERTIRNITFEITAGFRFLRKVEYID